MDLNARSRAARHTVASASEGVRRTILAAYRCRHLINRAELPRMTVLGLVRDHLLLSSSVWFDTAWYLRQYPDVASSGVDAVAHYQAFGAREGRDPGPRFSTSFYLEGNRDVAVSGMNPLVHFIKHGMAEGRLPRAGSGPAGTRQGALGEIGIAFPGSAASPVPGPSERRIAIVVKNCSSPRATAYIRVLLPWRLVAPSVACLPVLVEAEFLLTEEVAEFDAVVIQRDAVSPRIVTDVVDNLRKAGIPFLFEIDDLLWDLPSDHPDRAEYANASGSLTHLMRHARMISTSTEKLRTEISRHNLSTMVVPNSPWFECWEERIDPGIVEEVRRANRIDREVPRILYMGSASHAHDLAMVSPAIADVVRRRPDAEVIQIGGGGLLPSARRLAVPHRFSSYEAFVQWFRIVAGTATIGIAPLRGTRFDSMKSDVKALDYGRAGLPAIFSDAEPYRGSIVDGRTGILAGNTHESWTRAILDLLDDQAGREQLAMGARQWARERGSAARRAHERFAREALGTEAPADCRLGQHPSEERSGMG
ncbi:glycosyltransferase [Hoyosella sp. G463]|uniref:Glycosyltransferase n=2 Tax=Lolliginicoccus lacisalsi TaxID=2742202 RepID=A0A927PLW2_9ACTN|nr:glycosyltransferase [Lolliginicoccus lacisalsi]